MKQPIDEIKHLRKSVSLWQKAANADFSAYAAKAADH